MKEKSLPFFPQTLARLTILGQCVAQGYCFRRNSELQTGGQLHATQDAQRIFGESRRCVAQYPCIKVAASVEGIAKLPRVRIPGHRVYGEVSSCKRLVDRHAGIDLSRQPRKGCAISGYTGGNGKIDRQALQFEDLECFPDELHGEVLSQQRMDLTGLEPNDFDIQILRLSTEHKIAYAAADQPGPSASTTNGVCDTAKDLPEVGIFKAKADRHSDHRFTEKRRGFFR